MIYIPDILLTIFYACFGIFLMLTANTIIDFFVPGKFSEEIKRGNCAVAWLSAGSFIGIGEILRAVIMSPAVTTADTYCATFRENENPSFSSDAGCCCHHDHAVGTSEIKCEAVNCVYNQQKVCSAPAVQINDLDASCNTFKAR